MSDNSFQDIVSGSGRSIRRIPVSKKPKVDNSFGGQSPVGRSGGSGGGYSDRKSPRFGIWIVAIISIIIFLFVFPLLFSGAKIEVTPKQEAVLIDGTFTAFKEAQSGELSFEVMSITRSLSDEVPATGEEFVEEKASGKIVVYNNYSTASQKLIKNTRFETPDGLIYRIKDAVVVPGRSTVDGETVPGSLEVTVYADKSGDTYNVDMLDFTIPGLKGDPRYSKFYARSQTAIAGGASGTIRKASNDDVVSASDRLGSKLSAEILEEALSVKPEGFLLLNNSYVIRSDSKTSNGTGDNVLVTEEATFYGLIFDEKEFAQFVAENTIASYKGANVELFGLDNLNLTIVDSSSINLEIAESVNFKISGNTKVVWTFDEEALISDLGGESRRKATSILSSYSDSIETAKVIIRPFWGRSITDKEDKIKLKKIIK